MRIIAGTHRGRRLAAPPGSVTRPMLDRVRESVFATLGERVPGARVLDLFAGTGSLGLEALSRGAARARLVERDRDVHRVLVANVEALGLGERAWAARGDALDPRRWGLSEGERVDLVFLDPPYGLLEDPSRRAAVLRAVASLVIPVLEPDGLAVLHAPRRALDPRDFGGGVESEKRVYGSSAIFYLTPAAAPEAAERDEA